MSRSDISSPDELLFLVMPFDTLSSALEVYLYTTIALYKSTFCLLTYLQANRRFFERSLNRSIDRSINQSINPSINIVSFTASSTSY